MNDFIKVYKDTSLKSVALSGQTLNFTYILTDGSEKTVGVDISKFLTESEYGNGLQVVDSKVSVLKDSSSESFLTVSSSGIKLSGVQTAINTAVNNLDATVSGNGTHVDVTVSQLNGKITGVTVAESDIASASALTNLTNWCAYMSGHTTASAVTSIPTTKRLCIATISTSQTLGLNGSITDGREVHTAGNVHNSLQQLFLLGIFLLGEQGFIQLDYVCGNVLEHIQRGVTAAEIVD